MVIKANEKRIEALEKLKKRILSGCTVWTIFTEGGGAARAIPNKPPIGNEICVCGGLTSANFGACVVYPNIKVSTQKECQITAISLNLQILINPPAALIFAQDISICNRVKNGAKPFIASQMEKARDPNLNLTQGAC